MPERLRAIGFPGANSIEAVAKILCDLASKASVARPQVLTVSPLSGCNATLHLDAAGQPSKLEIIAEGPLQTVIFVECEGSRFRGFTCFDSRPVAPLQLTCAGSEFRGGSAVIKPTFFIHAGGEDVLSGTIIDRREEENRFTGQPVTAGTVWIPGLLVPFFGASDSAPGSEVEWRGSFVAEVAGWV